MSESPKTSNDVAVYIDYENLYISLRSTVRKNPDFDVILEKCREWGRVTIARAYADWSEFARVVTGQMFSSGIEPIYVPTRKFYDAKTRSQATKNAVDIHIAIDIIKDVLTTKNIDTFVLVSGDRDFVPLINQIRAAGKEIYAIGVAGCTSSELAVAVDGMYYYHQLLQSDEELQEEQHDVYAKLARAVEIARARGYRSTLGVVKPIMREVIAGFDEKNFRNSKGVPYAKFQDFVKDAETHGFVKTSVTPGGGSLEIWLAGENITEARKKTEERKAAGGGRGRGAGRGRSGGSASESRSRSKAAAADEAAVEAEAAEGDEDSAEEDGKTARRRTRRGSRGGRGRRRRSDEVAAEAGEDSADSEEEIESPDEAAETEDVSEGATEVAAEAEERADSAEPEGGDQDDDDAELVDLPGEVEDDLRTILEEFGSRAPSQRRLVARLKKAAGDGELKGEYREGQFLLAVRKGLEEGWLEKVSKGFYSGLKWAGEGASEEASAGA